MEKLNMKKKLPLRLLGAILAALLVLAVFPINALAEDSEVGLKVDLGYPGAQTYAIVGDKVIVTVSLTKNDGVASMFLTANYDTEAFELVSAVLKSETFSVNDPDSWAVSQDRKDLGIVNTDTAGKVIFNWIYSGALIGGLHSKRNCETIGAFAEFELKVKNADLEDEKYKVTVTPDSDNFFAITETGDEEVTVTGLEDKSVTVKKSYTVTYNANGGTGEPEAQKKVDGVALTLSETVPTRDGYKFLGWATTAEGTAMYQPGGTYEENAALELFAVWQRNNSTLAVGESVGVAGGTVIVPVTVGGETMSAKKVELTVNVPEGLTFNVADDWTQNGNKISKTYDTAQSMTSGSKLVNLKFKIPEGAEVGTEYTVLITANIDDNFAPSATDGKVSVVDYILGDVNGDGYVNSKDASLVLRYDARLIDTINTVAGDVNGDGLTNSKDASLILRFDAHLITEFPKNNN